MLARVCLRARLPFVVLGPHDAVDDDSGVDYFAPGGRGVLGEHFFKVFFEPALHKRARPRRVQRGVGLDLGGVKEQLFAPHQPGRKALLHDPLEEAAEDLQAEAFPDPCGSARSDRAAAR